MQPYPHHYTASATGQPDGLTRATLSLPAGSDETRATVLLEKAEHSCLIANSLKGQRELHVHFKPAG